MEYQQYTLNNGLQIVHRPIDSEVSHLGILIKAGSRDEQQGEHGIAHLIEHCLFKGTKKRRAYHILTRLEDVGAEINAYTSKEETCIYASFLPAYFERTLELLTDILFHSVFPEKEIEKEKQVVIDEIHSYQELPYETINEEFERRLFPGNALGMSILGTPKGIRKHNVATIRAFFERHYRPANMILSSHGPVSFQKLVKLSEKYFPGNEGITEFDFSKAFRNPVEEYTAFRDIMKGRTSQSHCIIGAPAYAYYHPAKYSIALLNNLLGGPAMSSRLSYTLREKLGLAYNVESNYSAFTDTGQILIYFATEANALEKAMDRVFTELKKIREQKLGTLQLHKAKQQYAGQMALSMESNLNQMISAGKSVMIFNRIESLAEIEGKIAAVRAEEILETANEILNDNNISVLMMKNEKRQHGN